MWMKPFIEKYKFLSSIKVTLMKIIIGLGYVGFANAINLHQAKMLCALI